MSTVSRICWRVFLIQWKRNWKHTCIITYIVHYASLAWLRQGRDYPWTSRYSTQPMHIARHEHQQLNCERRGHFFMRTVQRWFFFVRARFWPPASRTWNMKTAYREERESTVDRPGLVWPIIEVISVLMDISWKSSWSVLLRISFFPWSIGCWFCYRCCCCTLCLMYVTVKGAGGAGAFFAWGVVSLR